MGGNKSVVKVMEAIINLDEFKIDITFYIMFNSVKDHIRVVVKAKFIIFED